MLLILIVYFHCIVCSKKSRWALKLGKEIKKVTLEDLLVEKKPKVDAQIFLPDKKSEYKANGFHSNLTKSRL